MGVEQHRQQDGHRNRQHNAEAAGQPLHDGDADIVGVDDLLIGQVIGVVQHQHAHAAAGKGQNQGVAVGAHHIPAHMHPGFKQLFSGDRGVLGVNLSDRAADGHGHVHHSPQAGDEQAGEKQAAHLNPAHIPEGEQALNIRHIPSGNPGGDAEDCGGKPGDHHSGNGAPRGHHRLFGGTADEIHSDQRGDDAHKYRHPEGRAAPVHQRQIYKQDAQKGKHQSQGPLQPLLSAHKAEHHQIEGRKDINGHLSVLGVDGVDHRIPGNALHHHHVHAHGASGAEQIPGAAGSLQLLPLLGAGEHADHDPLLSHPASIRHEVVLDNFGDHRLFKGLPLPGYQRYLVHLIDPDDKGQKKQQQQNGGTPPLQQILGVQIEIAHPYFLISSQSESGHTPASAGVRLRLSKKSKDFSDSLQKCHYFPAVQRRKSPRCAR